MSEVPEKMPEPGDWCLVWAQVLPGKEVHPEDLAVRICSHNADPLVHVRRDYVVIPEEQPPWRAWCGSLIEYQTNAIPGTNTVLLQCTKGLGHTGTHIHPATLGWSDKQAIGDREQR